MSNFFNAILNRELQGFIDVNLKSDLSSLILKGSPSKSVSIQQIAEQIAAKKKCEKKLPSWFSSKDIIYPNKVSIEQSSSEITAKYKANLISGSSLIDLTGGFGVDAYYFSNRVKEVVHCEINKDLSNIVVHNYKTLQNNNIKCLATNGIEFIQSNPTRYDWIYVDPSRRNELKEKVFLLDDCLPNVPKHLDSLFKKSDNILLKLSPIMDISAATDKLKFVKEIHIVAVKNEVKELLFLLAKGHFDTIEVKTINFNGKTRQHFNFNLGHLSITEYSEPKTYIYEPNVAILKSGGFPEIASLYNIAKLHQHSHLYTSKELISFPGRVFKLKHEVTYNKKVLKKLIPSLKANITTRNFPETVAQIRKKTGFKDGGKDYLFFTTSHKNKHIVLICEKL